MKQNIDHLLEAISQADEQGNPAAIFGLLAEQTIWDYAHLVFDNPEQGSSHGPILLEGIGLSFSNLQNPLAAVQLILRVLSISSDGLVYNAAQRAALRLLPFITNEQAKQFYVVLENGYRSTVDGDLFIAVKALEGAVMLCIFRNDKGLLLRAMGLLLTEFPPIPEDPYDPAYLPVEALRLMGRCYDRNPASSGIGEKITELVSSGNIAVANEARFNMGIVKLYEAFQSSDKSTLVTALALAQDLFQAAYKGEENRTDAELFLAICKCYLSLLTFRSPDEVNEIIHQAKDVLTERLLVMGEDASPWAMDVEYNLVSLLTHFDTWARQLAEASRWPDIKPPMSALASAYTAIREYDALGGFVAAASKTGANIVMLTQVASQFIRIQEIRAKLENVLADQIWRQAAPDYEIAFYELILEEVKQSPLPKDDAAARLEQIRAAAETNDPEFAQQIAQLQAKGMETNDILVNLAWKRVLQDRKVDAERYVYPLVEEILHNLLGDLQQKLGWEISSSRWKYLKLASGISAHYLYKLFTANCEEETKFLFSKPDGLGIEATEKDLENHFYRSFAFSIPIVAIEQQPQGIAPGRPDLAFRFPDNILFPIEVKREKADISRPNIHESYLAQAQSYAAAQQQISFLLVLDVTPKQIGTPLMNIVDYCYTDERYIPGAQVPNHVIVVIVPANRLTPSAHSWQRKKRS